MNGRVCTKCLEFKEWEHFAINKKGLNDRKSVCKTCSNHKQRALSKKRREEDPEGWRLSRWEKHIKSAYGLTPEQYWGMFEAQQHRCAICGVEENTVAFTTSRMYVDHCHTTGKVRSLLCYYCNTILGLCKENTETLQNCIAYLEKHNELHN